LSKLPLQATAIEPTHCRDGEQLSDNSFACQMMERRCWSRYA
jgi:hypothetical protein